MSSSPTRKPHRWSRKKATESYDDSNVGPSIISSRERFKRTPSGSMDDSSLNLRSQPQQPLNSSKSPKTKRFRKSKGGSGGSKREPTSSTAHQSPTSKKGGKGKLLSNVFKWSKKSKGKNDDPQDFDDDDDDSGGMLGMLAKKNKVKFTPNPSSDPSLDDDLSDVGMGDPMQPGSGYNSSDDEGLKFSRGGRRGRGGSRRNPNEHAETSNPMGNVSFDFSAMAESTASTTPTQESAVTQSYQPGNTSRGQRAERANYNNSQAPPAPPPKSAERAQYNVYKGNSNVKPTSRVRPYHCFNGAKYMTEEDIYSDSLMPTQSDNYDFLKSYLAPTLSRNTRINEKSDKMWGSPRDDGRIGALRVEVLGCIGLARQKPEVSVYIVCGDAAFNTDVIQGYRSPMWPKNSRRAAVFPVHHAYASFYVGVFDAKKRKNKENDVYCGRVAIDIATLRPDTDYDITMPLRASALVYDRKKRGVIRLRFALHWFSERAAIVSYLRTPRSLLSKSSLVEGLPTIPCADPKTFRNVAVTVYGLDLPGKYSKSAFRATLREFNLYQINLRYLLKHLVRGAVLYEKPIFSVYLFLASMHCVMAGSVRMVPPYSVFYIMMLFAENYFHYVLGRPFNFGYKPLTAVELAIGLLKDGVAGSGFRPLTANKRSKQRSQKQAQKIRRMNSQNENEEGEDEGEIEPMDHREFPFSERDAYPLFGVEDALAPSSKAASGGNTRLHGRLSVYYAPEPTTPSGEPTPTPEEDEDDDSSGEDSEDRDDDTVISESQMGDNMFDDVSDGDADSMEPDPDDNEAGDSPYGDSPYGEDRPPSASRAIRRIKMGPVQNADQKGGSKGVSPQVSLQRVEHRMQRMSRNVSVETVHAPATHETVGAEGTGTSANTGAQQAQLDAIRKKKMPLDEFDKQLGLQVKNLNLVQRIASGFLGPLMRMLRIPIYLTRVSFNVATWRDPILSWWAFLFLSVLFVVLIFFPWRPFFFLVSLLGFGPQNIFVRKYLEKRKAKKVAQAKEDAEEAENEKYLEQSEEQAPSQVQTSDKQDGPSVDKKEKKSFFSKKFAFGGKRVESTDSNVTDVPQFVEERPAFTSQMHGQTSSSKKLPPRAIAIPYSRLMKSRFYDWPPDPTVSRATPIMLAADSPSSPHVEPVPEIPTTIIPPARTNRPAAGNRRRSG